MSHICFSRIARKLLEKSRKCLGQFLDISETQSIVDMLEKQRSRQLTRWDDPSFSSAELQAKWLPSLVEIERYWAQQVSHLSGGHLSPYRIEVLKALRGHAHLPQLIGKLLQAPLWDRAPSD